jgi:20S proteasome subunit beta 7
MVIDILFLIRNPIVVGGSVIGLYYKNGVMIASDTGACYGSMKMFKECDRIEKINNNVLIGSFSPEKKIN